MDDAVSVPLPPPLTNLKLEVHTSDSGSRTLTASFLVNVRDTMLEDFEAACHDAVLKHAHARGHMPVGPILITTEAYDAAAYEADYGTGTPDEPVRRTMDDLRLKVETTLGNIARVKADVELGLSL